MPPLTDPTRLDAYRDALQNWKYTGYVQFELPDEAYRWIRRQLGAITLRDLARRMHEYVASGGVIDEVRETRPEWSGQYEFHHDLRLEVEDQSVYVETRLNYRLPLIADESWILVVNIHAP